MENLQYEKLEKIHTSKKYGMLQSFKKIQRASERFNSNKVEINLMHLNVLLKLKMANFYAL